MNLFYSTKTYILGCNSIPIDSVQKPQIKLEAIKLA